MSLLCFRYFLQIRMFFLKNIFFKKNHSYLRMLVDCVRQRLLGKRRLRLFSTKLHSMKRHSTKRRSTKCRLTTKVIRLHWKRFGASSSTSDPIITDPFSGSFFALYHYSVVFSSSFFHRTDSIKFDAFVKTILINNLLQMFVYKLKSTSTIVV